MTSKDTSPINQNQPQPLETQIQQLKQHELKLKEDLKQQEIKIFEYQQQTEQYKRQQDGYKRQLDNTLKLKKCMEDNLEVKINELSEQIKQKKTKILALKNVQYPQQIIIIFKDQTTLNDQLNTLKRDINQKNIETLQLQRKISEFEKLFGSKTGLGIEFSPQLLSIVKELKGQVTVLEEFQKRRDQESDLMKQYFEEIQEIKQTKQQELLQVKQKTKEKIQTIKKKYDNSLLSLISQLSLLNQQNSELRLQLLDFANPSLKSNDQIAQLATLASENQQLKDVLKHKDSTLETHELILKQFSFEIQKQANQIADLEQNMAFIHAEKSSLQSSKETFPYVLKETLKWVTNKKNTLKTALQCLNQQDQKEIKQAINEVGFNLNF